MAKWLRQRFAKPLFPGSNPGGASIKKADGHSCSAVFFSAMYFFSNSRLHHTEDLE